MGMKKLMKYARLKKGKERSEKDDRKHKRKQE